MENNGKVAKFIELRAQGNSFDKIAEEIGMSKQTLLNWNKKFEDDVQSLKGVEIRSLQEQFFATKEQRMKGLGEKIKAINAALDKKDFSDLGTDKLLDYFIKYMYILKKESNEMDLSDFF